MSPATTEDDGRVSEQTEIDREAAASGVALRHEANLIERERQAFLREEGVDLRNRLADERDQQADERDRQADERDRQADERDRESDQREIDAQVMVTAHDYPTETVTEDGA